MFNLATALKSYRESGSLNEQINLLGFLDDHFFLTKSGDIGAVLSVSGIDYEGLSAIEIDQHTKRLEAAFKVLDDQCRIYQYLFKRNDPPIPTREYADPVVNAAIRNRTHYFQSKADRLYSLEIVYAVVCETGKQKKTIQRIFANGNGNGQQVAGGWREIRALLSAKDQIVLIDEELRHGRAALRQRIESFLLQISDFLPARLLHKQEAFRALRRMVNFAPQKLDLVRLKHDSFLDFYLCDSHLECHRGFLRLDDYYLKVLTLKEPSAQSFPLIFQKLLEVEANFFVATEWKREQADKTRSRIHSRRRHFHNTKRSLTSYLNTSDQSVTAQDVLVDDSKEAQIHSLGQALTDIEVNGNYFGEFSISVVVYGPDLQKLESVCAEFHKVFAIHDAQLYEERYNLLNAYLACVPGNAAFNLRRILVSNTNYADYSFLFTLDSGDAENSHLRHEYLAVLETNHHTPYFFNLHYRDVAHTIILGRTGSGKTTLLNILANFISQNERILIIEDTAEIQITSPNLVRFEARREQDGLPAVTIRDLLKASLRHRPDRILLGEIRGAEAFDLLQLLNTGHSGTISTVHANSAQQALSRFTSCVLQSGVELPYRAIKSNIADSLNLLIHIDRLPGRRFVSQVLKIKGHDQEQDRYAFEPIFTCEEDS